jgi:FlaG/FlaF family flagellin (archaellin)
MMDDKTAEKIKKAVAPVVGSALSFAVVGAATAIIKKLVVTNVEEKDLKGNTTLSPTEDNVTASKVEASGQDTEASGAKDEVKGQDGELSGLATDAAVGDTEATVMEGGATAARTKAGAADIEVKALKMT